MIVDDKESNKNNEDQKESNSLCKSIRNILLLSLEAKDVQTKQKHKELFTPSNILLVILR